MQGELGIERGRLPKIFDGPLNIPACSLVQVKTSLQVKSIGLGVRCLVFASAHIGFSQLCSETIGNVISSRLYSIPAYSQCAKKG